MFIRLLYIVKNNLNYKEFYSTNYIANFLKIYPGWYIIYTMKAEEFDKKFDSGEDISKYLDFSKARRPGREQKRVNVDFPVWMIQALDKEAARLGEGPRRLSEKRQIENERREAEKKKQEDERRAAITFKDYFEGTYYPDAKLSKKKGSYEAEKYLFDGWIEPIIGHLSFSNILPLNIRAIRKRMSDAGRSAATIKYAYAVISQVWNHARSDGFVNRDCPTKDKTAKLETINNKRVRFLSHEETEALLADLLISSPQLHDMALLSLHCGLRAGEIFKITWDCVDFKQDMILLKDTKSKHSRYAYMTKPVKEMLKRREGVKRGLVFRDRKRKQITSVSNTFDRGVKRLKFNNDVKDRRDRVVFNKLSQNFASWHVMN
jgi:integrase